MSVPKVTIVADVVNDMLIITLYEPLLPQKKHKRFSKICKALFSFCTHQMFMPPSWRLTDGKNFKNTKMNNL